MYTIMTRLSHHRFAGPDREFQLPKRPVGLWWSALVNRGDGRLLLFLWRSQASIL